MPEGPDAIWMRPEHAGVGRPAERSRGELTAVAIAVADRDGLDAVSMRRIAAELGTGPASLYRYVASRDDLLDLMADSVAAEFDLAGAAGDWLADLLDVGRQAREIMLRHSWLPGLVISRGALGPRGADLLEYVLGVLTDQPADAITKVEAFAMLMAVTAAYVQHETSAGLAGQERQAAYLVRVATDGRHPQIAAMLASAVPSPTHDQDRFALVLARVLTGVLSQEFGPQE
jgi:AcrR family transcriptional regulator